MRNKGALSKLVYTGVILGLLVSSMVLGCASGATPTPTATTKPSSTPTATVAPKPTATPTPTASGQPQYGGVFKIAERQVADSLGYPAKVVSIFTVQEAAPALETLLRNDTAGNFVPWLASAFTNDVDAKTITLTLRKGVKFQDGTDFNATAVQWNLNQLIAAKTASAKLFKSIDAVDDYTVRINLSAWDSTVIGNFAQTAGVMVSPAAVQANGVDWAVKNPVGTGPFKFVNWSTGVSISFNRFDGYWQKGKPYLDGVQIVFINDDTTREISLRAGEIDSAISLISTNIPKLQADGFVIANRPTGPITTSLIPDSANKKSPFADVRVRQAAAYAIDNPSLVKAVFGVGGAVSSNQFTFPGNWSYNPAVVGYPYDPAKAKQLLTAAGYPNGFQTRIMANSGSPGQVTFYTGVQGYLKAVGIDATMDVITGPQLNDLVFNGKSWEGLAQYRGSADPDWITGMVAYYTGNGAYVNMLLPDDYMQAISSAVSASDFATKQKFAQQAMQLFIDKYALAIPSYNALDGMTLWSNVHDTGLYQTNIVIWTPENTWLGKR